MSFLDTLKVVVFFGALAAIFLVSLGRRLFGWGLKPNQLKPSPAAAPQQPGRGQISPSAQQQYYPQPQGQQYYQQSGQGRISPQEAQQQQRKF